MSWCFWLVTLSVKLNTTPHRKDVSSLVKMTVLCFPTWALTSVKRKGPWTICVVISKGTISPPPRLRTCIPPILPPDVQIVSTFMQVQQSHLVSSRAVMRIWKIQQIVTNTCFYLFTCITSVEDKDCKGFCFSFRSSSVLICGQMTTSFSTAVADTSGLILKCDAPHCSFTCYGHGHTFGLQWHGTFWGNTERQITRSAAVIKTIITDQKPPSVFNRSNYNWCFACLYHNKNITFCYVLYIWGVSEFQYKAVLIFIFIHLVWKVLSRSLIVFEKVDA